MRYFVLEVDEDFVAPRLKGWFGRLDTKNFDVGQYDPAPGRMVFHVESHMQTVFTDVILHPRLMVSKRAMHVIKHYEPFVQFVRILLVDRERKDSKAYYIPDLETVDVLTENSRFNLDKSVIHHLEVDADKIRDKTLIQVANVNRTCILIHSNVVESLLRRGMIGIGLQQVDIRYQTV